MRSPSGSPEMTRFADAHPLDEAPDDLRPPVDTEPVHSLIMRNGLGSRRGTDHDPHEDRAAPYLVNHDTPTAAARRPDQLRRLRDRLSPPAGPNRHLRAEQLGERS